MSTNLPPTDPQTVAVAVGMVGVRPAAKTSATAQAPGIDSILRTRQ